MSPVAISLHQETGLCKVGESFSFPFLEFGNSCQAEMNCEQLVTRENKGRRKKGENVDSKTIFSQFTFLLSLGTW